MKKETLLQMAQGFALIATALEDEANNDKFTPATEPAADVPVTNEPDNPPAEEEDGYSIAELKAKKVTELKKIAEEMGAEYPDKVKKDDLIDIIMEFEVDEEEEEDDAAGAEDEADVTEEVEDGEDEDGEDEDEEGIDLEELSLKELKSLAKENGISFPKNVKAGELRDIIEEELSEEDGEDEDEGEEEEELSLEDLDEMNLKELKALADEYEVEYPKVVKAPKLREILAEELFEGEDDTEDDSTELDEEDLAEQFGLNEMSVEELAEILTEHGIKAKGKKQALISKVLDAIEEGIIELEDEEEGE